METETFVMENSWKIIIHMLWEPWTGDSKQYSNHFDLISILVNFFMWIGTDIVTMILYDFLEASWMSLSNLRTDVQLDIIKF